MQINKAQISFTSAQAGQYLCHLLTTVKFLNFRISENFDVIYLILKKRPNFMVFRQKDANGIAKSEDPDQTAPLGAV